MPTKCEDCGEYSYSIFFTRDWKKLCGKCYKKVIHENEKENNRIDDNIERQSKRRIPWD